MPNNIMPRRRRRAAALSAAVAFALLPAVASAQGGGAGSAPPVPDARVTPEIAAEAEGARIPAAKPEVQIVVIGVPGGQWAVSSTYPKRVSPEEALGRMRRLIQESGWKPSGEVKFTEGGAPGGGPGGEKLGSASFITASPVVDVANGRLPLEPVIRAFADLSRINITVFPPTGFAFNGLGDYADKNVEVGLARGQGTFTYVVNIKNHTPRSLSLPSQSAPAGAVRGRAGRPAAAAAVLLLAAVAAIVTFLAAKAITARRQ